MGFNVANPLHVLTGAMGLAAAAKGAEARPLAGGNHLQIHNGHSFGADHVGSAILPKSTYTTEQLNHLVEGHGVSSLKDSGPKLSFGSFTVREIRTKTTRGAQKAGAAAKPAPKQLTQGQTTAGGRKLKQYGWYGYDEHRRWRGDRWRLPYCGAPVDRGLIPSILGSIFGYQTYGSAGYECRDTYGYIQYGKK